jgi:hypothetical protein
MQIFVLAKNVAFSARRLLTYLYFFQQEEYDGCRFLRWLLRSPSIDCCATISLPARAKRVFVAGRRTEGSPLSITGVVRAVDGCARGTPLHSGDLRSM